MISLLNKNNKISEEKTNLVVTYPRTVNIILGNYPYPEIIHNFIINIKSNLDSSMKNYTKNIIEIKTYIYLFDKKCQINKNIK